MTPVSITISAGLLLVLQSGNREHKDVLRSRTEVTLYLDPHTKLHNRTFIPVSYLPCSLKVPHQSVSDISQSNDPNFPILQAECRDKSSVTKLHKISQTPAMS